MSNILVFGDSIGQGYYDAEGGWVDRLKRYYLEEEIKRKWEQSVNVFNLALSGDTSENILARITKETSQRIWENHETILIFAAGINDSILIDGKSKVPEKEYQSNLARAVTYFKTYTKKIIFIGLTPVEEAKVTPMPWSPTEYWFNKRIKKYDKLLKAFCKDNSLPYIYLYDKLTEEDLFDGAHPNSKGHEKIFGTVKNFLENKKYI